MCCGADMHDSDFASRRQVLHVTFAVLSGVVIGLNFFAVCFWLANPSRKDFDFNEECHERKQQDNLKCDLFRVTAFLGTSVFLVLWLPVFFGNVMEHYGKKIEQEIVNFKWLYKLLLIFPFLCGVAVFSIGIYVIVSSDEEWAYYTYVYISIILGCVLGLGLIAVSAFYFGSFLILETFLFIGYSEQEIRREYMFGGIPVDEDSNTPEGLRKKSTRLKKLEKDLQKLEKKHKDRERELEEQEQELKTWEERLKITDLEMG